MARQPPLQSLNEVCLVLDSIAETLEQRSKVYDERRKIDDERDAAAVKSRAELIEMNVTWGMRVAKLEEKWTSFFSDQGAFPQMVKQANGHSTKIERLMWLVAVGFGIVITLQFMVGRK